MPRVIKFPINLKKVLEEIKANKGMWKHGDKYIIKHIEVERLAKAFNITTDVELKDCDLPKGCAVVKGLAIFENKRYTTLGEVSPLNNNFPYPVAIAEKRAVDRAVLKALNIHGQIYSDVEMPPVENENSGIKLDHAEIILDRIKNATHQANLKEIISDNKEFLTELKKKDLEKAEFIKKAFEDKQQQLIGG